MKLLLDTHALLWWLNDDSRIGRRARDFVADPENDVLVSRVSLWDIVVKARIGKLEAGVGEITAAIAREGFEPLDISTAHLMACQGLPLHSDHRDPFDHLLIAQAITEHAAFVSQDRHASRYALRCITCSDPTGSEPQ